MILVGIIIGLIIVIFYQKHRYEKLLKQCKENIEAVVTGEYDDWLEEEEKCCE